MSTTENTLRYLKTDFQSHKDAILQRVRARWPRLWNDFLTNSFGIVLVELIAWSTATVAFLINRLAGENYISTMTLRESAVRVGGNFGYQLRGPLPASVACEAALTTAQTADVTILKGTLLRTADDASTPFEVSQDYTIKAGDVSPITPVISIAPGLFGANTIAARVSLSQGSVNADLTDSSIDLTKFVVAGQLFQASGDTTVYQIFGIESAPSAVSNNRLVLASAWAGATGTVEATVSDRRIILSQGQTIVDRFVSPSLASPGFSVKLSRSPVIDNSVSIAVNNEIWTRVANLVASNLDSQVFSVKTFSTGETVAVFGDNNFGAQIPTEAIIEVTYRIGGGSAGNIPVNSVNTSITGIIKSTSSPVTVTVTNASSSGIGGRDAETLEEARVNIPYFVRSNDRAVTLDDYQTVAQQFSDPQFGSVAYARSAVRTENALLEGNIVVIYAWTTGAGGGLVPLSPQLKLALQSYMQTKACGTDLVQIYDGSAKPLPISIRFKTFGGFSVVDTKRTLLTTLNNTITALRPGQPVIFSDLVRSLDSVTGVDTLTIATPIADLYTSSTTELFTVPQDSYAYALDRNGVGTPVTSVPDGVAISLYESQLPVFPVEAWSFRLFLGINELTVLPGLKPGFAQLFGDNLSINAALDDDRSRSYGSEVNLLTGKIRLWLKGAPGDLSMKLVPVQGYSSIRPINIYVGYIGDNSQTKRREIRAALRTWSDGLPIGGTLYAKAVSGVTASKSNVTEVVGSVVGVDAVVRVALDTPANTADRISPVDAELLKSGGIVLNSQQD